MSSTNDGVTMNEGSAPDLAGVGVTPDSHGSVAENSSNSSDEAEQQQQQQQQQPVSAAPASPAGSTGSSSSGGSGLLASLGIPPPPPHVPGLQLPINKAATLSALVSPYVSNTIDELHIENCTRLTIALPRDTPNGALVTLNFPKHCNIVDVLDVVIAHLPKAGLLPEAEARAAAGTEVVIGADGKIEEKNSVAQGVETTEVNENAESDPNTESTPGTLAVLPSEMILQIADFLTDSELVTFKSACRLAREVLNTEERGRMATYSNLSPSARFEADAKADRDGIALNKRVPCYACKTTHRPSKFIDQDKAPGNPLRVCKGACEVVALTPQLPITPRLLRYFLRALELTPKEIEEDRWEHPADKFLVYDIPSGVWKVTKLKHMVPHPDLTYVEDLGKRGGRFAKKFPGAYAVLKGKQEPTLANIKKFEISFASYDGDELTTAVTYEIELVHLVYGRFPTAYYLTHADGIAPSYVDGDLKMVKFLRTALCAHLAFDSPAIVRTLREIISVVCQRFQYFPVAMAMNMRPAKVYVLCGVCEAVIFIKSSKNWWTEAPTLKIEVRRNLGNANCATNRYWMNAVTPQRHVHT